MKIVILADSISTQKAGIHYYGKQLVKNIITTYPRHNYTVISTDRLDFGNTENIVVPYNSNIPFGLRWRQLFKLPKLVKKLKPDVVIELAHFGPFRLSSSIKKVTVIHDLGPITQTKYHGFLSTLFHKMLMPSILNNADYIICNSKTTSKLIIEHFPKTERKLIISYPKVSSHLKYNNKKNRSNYLVSVGTIEPRKNYVNLLKGYDFYRKQGGTCLLKIIGIEGWGMENFMANLKQASFKSDIEVYVNLERSKVLNFIADAKALVSASHFEGFGLPLLEAMSFSVPMILSDIDIYREVAADAAIYFDHNNPSDIARNLLAFEQTTINYQEKSARRFDTFLSHKLELPFLVER